MRYHKRVLPQGDSGTAPPGIHVVTDPATGRARASRNHPDQQKGPAGEQVIRSTARVLLLQRAAQLRAEAVELDALANQLPVQMVADAENAMTKLVKAALAR